MWALALIRKALVAIVFIVCSRPSVWVEPVEAFVRMATACPCGVREPGVARRESNFLLLRQEKVTKEKATPSLRPLRCAKGQTCGVSVAGCAVELTALRCSFVQTSTASQFTKHARSDARATPQPPRRRRSQQGFGQPDIHTGHRCARPGLRSAWRLRPRNGAERSDGPDGCPLPGFPSARAEKRRAGGACVCRRTHALRALTCRSCLNGARSAQ